MEGARGRVHDSPKERERNERVDLPRGGLFPVENYGGGEGGYQEGWMILWEEDRGAAEE